MATILTKKKDTSGAPSAGDLTNSSGGAELAVNTADKRLYTKDSGGSVVEVGINPTSITTGTLNTSGAVVFNDAGADVDFRVEGDTNANLLFVDASADAVGIGTSSPNIFSLTGVTSILGIQASGTNQGGNIQLAGTGTGGSWINFGNETIRRAVVGGVDGSALAFYTNGTNSGNGVTERMRIDSGGAVLIGTTSTIGSAKLVIAGDIAFGGASGSDMTISNSQSGGIKYLADNNGHTFQTYVGGWLTRLLITDGGEVLIGKTTADDATNDGVRANQVGEFSVTRSSLINAVTTMRVYSQDASAYRFYIGMGGTVYATNTTISAISDQRHKENIRDLDVGLDAVMQLKPRKFDWKDGKGKNIKDDRGFIAQEIEQVFPDLIDEWLDPAPEGEEPYKAVRQDLIPVLVKAIQELKAELDTVKAELATLKGQ